MRTLFTLVFTACFAAFGFSQARMVFHGNIGLSFANGTQANPIYLVVDNPNPNAIEDAGTPGGPAILSENEFHKVKWNIGNATGGPYNVPFISTTGGTPEYVGTSVAITSAGSNDGSIEFSTYHHNNALATIPTGVTHMNGHPSGTPGNEVNTIDRFWVINADSYGTKPAINVAFSYDEDEFDGSMVEPDLLVQRFNPTNNSWLDLNLTTPSAATINAVANTIGPIAISSGNFYPAWTITSANNPLPIELLSFKPHCMGNGTVELRWTTAAEINNSHFTLERSEDGIIWETFADNIQGAGNSSSEQEYKHLDNNPFAGLTYYRLTQTDFDGTKETFDPAVSDCDGVGFELISAYSQASSDVIDLVVSAGRDEIFDLELYDMNGRLAMATSKVQLSEGLNYLQIDSHSLGFGMYIIKLQSQTELMTRKIALQ